jgi:putative acid phosphatase of HAD superfamily subfamily IIIB
MRITLFIVAAVLLGTASPAAAQNAPAPKPIVTSIDRVPMVELYDGGGGLPYLGSSTSYNAGDWENALRAYANGPDGIPLGDDSVYLQQVAQIDAIADKAIKKATPHGWRAKLRKARAAKHGHGHGHGPKNYAIVFDVDETLLSNITAIEADNFTFGPASQAEATNEIGKAIPSSLQLFNDAKARGLTIFLITGRRENSRAHTESNLQREGFSGYKQLVLKPDASTDSTVVYKSGARAAIEKQGYKIVANVGDQYSDLAGGHAASAFKLANPFYFLP